MAKKQIAYQLSNGEVEFHGGDEYAHLCIRVSIGTDLDAAKEYDAQPSEYYLERLEKIRQQGASTKYFRTSFRDTEFVLQWLGAKSSHLDYGTEWFACKIESATFDADIIKLAGKLRKATEDKYGDVTPLDILAVLHQIGARRVRYASDVYDGWIYQDDATPDDCLLPETWRDLRADKLQTESLETSKAN